MLMVIDINISYKILKKSKEKTNNRIYFQTVRYADQTILTSVSDFL